MNRDAFVNAQGYWDMPDYPHLLKHKHAVFLATRWDAACMVAELRNDGSATIPAAGTQMHMAFDARNAAILPDSATAGA